MILDKLFKRTPVTTPPKSFDLVVGERGTPLPQSVKEYPRPVAMIPLSTLDPVDLESVAAQVVAQYPDATAPTVEAGTGHALRRVTWEGYTFVILYIARPIAAETMETMIKGAEPTWPTVHEAFQAHQAHLIIQTVTDNDGGALPLTQIIRLTQFAAITATIAGAAGMGWTTAKRLFSVDDLVRLAPVCGVSAESLTLWMTLNAVEGKPFNGTPTLGFSSVGFSIFTGAEIEVDPAPFEADYIAAVIINLAWLIINQKLPYAKETPIRVAAPDGVIVTLTQGKTGRLAGDCLRVTLARKRSDETMPEITLS